MIGPSFPPAVPPSPLMQVWVSPLSVKRSTRPEPTFFQAFHSGEKPVEYCRGSPQFPKQTGSLDYSFLLTQLRLCSQAQEECQASVTDADERVLGARATQ
jgi:hypothetical protein